MGVRCSPLLLKEELKIMVDAVGSVGSAVGKGWLLDVDAIVLDEVHYLSDISRGTVWEETVSSFTCRTAFGSSIISYPYMCEVDLVVLEPEIYPNFL
jgi:hypothetical protein